MTSPRASGGSGPASSADGADAGSVVSGSFGMMQIIHPAVDRERLHDTLQSLAGMGDALARMSDAARQALPNLRAGFHPAAREVAVFTDRATGARFPDSDPGPTLVSDMVQAYIDAARDTHRRRLAARELEAEGWLTPAQVAEAFGLPPEFAYGPPVDLDANEELIRSTRGEFAYDPWEYGDREPEGPMHWTPPPEGEDVPPWP